MSYRGNSNEVVSHVCSNSALIRRKVYAIVCKLFLGCHFTVLLWTVVFKHAEWHQLSFKHKGLSVSSFFQSHYSPWKKKGCFIVKMILSYWLTHDTDTKSSTFPFFRALIVHSLALSTSLCSRSLCTHQCSQRVHLALTVRSASIYWSVG